jgi:hypothetical protein
MPRLTSLLTTAALALCAATVHAQATQATPDAAAAPGVVQRVGGAVERGGQAAVRGVKKGAHATARGVQRGAKATARGVQRGAHAASRGVKRGVGAAARGVERGAKATAGAAHRVAGKVSRPAKPVSPRRADQPLR